MFHQKTVGPTSFLAFSELEVIPDLIHAFTTRATDMIAQDARGSSRVLSGKAVFLSALGISEERVVQLKQIHSDRVVAIEGRHARGVAAERPKADGILLAQSGYFAVIKTADCLPVMVIHPAQRRVCALHAGWRGTRDRITSKGLKRFLAETRAHPDDLIVALGPCIRRCCYEVGVEVIEEFRAGGHEVSRIISGRQLDLVEANRLQLEELGVTRILDSGMCTACRTDLFYSYRREGRTGRLWALAGFSCR